MFSHPRIKLRWSNLSYKNSIIHQSNIPQSIIYSQLTSHTRQLTIQFQVSKVLPSVQQIQTIQWILSGVQSVQVRVNDPTWTSTGIHQWLPDHTIQYNRLTVQQSESRAKVPGWPWQFQSNWLTAIIQCSIHHSSYDTSVNSSSINPTSHNMFHHLLPFHVTQKALYSCAEAKLIINPI